MKLRISPSTMSRLFCDTKTLLSHWGWTSRTTGPALLVGKALDNAISGILNGELNIETAAAHVKQAEIETADEEYGPENLERVLREWYSRHLSPEARPENRFPFDKLYAVQKSFETSIGQLQLRTSQTRPVIEAIDVSVIGIIDWIGETKDWLDVVDLKTTRKNLDERYRLSFEMGPQLPAYKHAVAEKLEKPVRGAYIAAIQLRTLPSSEGRCAKHSPCSHSGRKDERCPRCVLYSQCGNQHLVDDFFMVNLPAQSDQMWKREALEAARDYYKIITGYETFADLPRAGVQGKRVYDACINCEFRSFCKADRPVDRIDEYLVQRVETDTTHIKSGLVA